VRTYHPLERLSRAKGMNAIVAVFMGMLIVAFFRVQVVGSDSWELRSESNRLRQLPIPAPRGTVYDRNGLILADNVPGYAITVLPAPRDSLLRTLAHLSEYMDISGERRERLIAYLDRYGNQPLVVDADADFAVVSALEERRSEFPGVYIEMRPRRRYLVGAAAGHVMGYVGEVTGDELESGEFRGDRYEQGMVVGKTGLEREYEERLQGYQGLRYVEMDARGRIVGDFGSFHTNPGAPGAELRVNIDMELQQWIHRIFPDSMIGAVVALDPADGSVLALYSAPSFDPNDFVGGIDANTWRALNTDERKPLYNRAVMGLYPPASTWKLATAGIALDQGVVDPDEEMPIPCTGSMWYGNRSWRCWNPQGHGYNNLAEAIGNSCDVYFYQIGLRIGLEQMLERANDIGFSRQCGIDLPQESKGDFPADKSYWSRVWGYTAQEGEVLNLAIGQGPNSQTPLKMAQFYVALARDGSAPPPTIAEGVTLGEGWKLNLRPEHIEALREGLRSVTAPGGTAHFGTTLEHWDVMGKTGTGEHRLSQAGLAPPHAWFAGMAGPFGGDPEIVVVVVVEYGASGSRTAAPIMAKTADFYLRKKHGIPLDTIQTLSEHLQTRGWPRWYRERYGSLP